MRSGCPGTTLARVLGGPLMLHGGLHNWGPVAPVQPAPARFPRRRAGATPGLAGTARGGATSHGLLALGRRAGPPSARHGLFPGRTMDPDPTVRLASSLARCQPTVVEGRHGGQLLALLKYPFYPLFILDNGMNLISKSLSVLTPA